MGIGLPPSRLLVVRGEGDDRICHLHVLHAVIPPHRSRCRRAPSPLLTVNAGFVDAAIVDAYVGNGLSVVDAAVIDVGCGVLSNVGAAWFYVVEVGRGCLGVAWLGDKQKHTLHQKCPSSSG